MAVAMKVKKGDLVQILAGKDRGKQGRIIEARPRDGRVLVENLNVMTRHTRPRLPRSLPRSIWTVSPFLIFIVAI